MKVDIKKFYDPLPSQKYLHESASKYKAYFGGFGSGKSRWLCYEMIFQLCRFPNNYYVAMRRTYPELDDTLYKDFMEYIEPLGIVEKHDRTNRNVTLRNGSIVSFRSFDTIGKIFSYNLGGFAIDQAEELPEEYFLALASRMRKLGITYRHALLSLNPSGHNWVWKRFIQSTMRNPNPRYDYVLALSDENHHLPEGYVDELRELYPARWVARFLDCKFNEFEGLVFDNFGDKNIINGLPIKPSEADYIIIGIDIGIDNPSAVLFTYYSPMIKALFVFDEIYESGLTIKPIANLIKARLRKWGIKKVWKYVIDPDAKKRQITSNRSALMDFRMEGIPAVPADNNVNYGLLVTNEMFGLEAYSEDAKIFLLDSLVNFFSEIYDYQYKSVKNTMIEENAPGKPKNKKDHLMTVIRYISLSLPLGWVHDDKKVVMIKTHFKKRFGINRKNKSIEVSKGIKAQWQKKSGVWQKSA